MMRALPRQILNAFVCLCIFTCYGFENARAEDAAHVGNVKDIASERFARNPQKNYLSLSIENDNFGGGTDQFYTSGVRLTYFNLNAQVPDQLEVIDDFIPTFDINDTTSVFYTLGHNIYTPQDITIAAKQDDDRPYAAFAYGSIGLLTLADNHVDELELTLGVIGPPALGEQVQKFVHKNISDSPEPQGWDNQLDFEPGIVVSWTRRWPRFARATFGDYDIRAIPNVNASLGNIYTYAGAGMTFAFGPYKGIIQDTPPRVRPATPGSGYFETPDENYTWQIFGSVDGRAVAQNIFLDGNTFSDSHSVDKKHFVADFTGGFSFTFDDYRLAYSLNFRTDEFDGQSDDSVFGSVTLSTRF